MPTVTMTADERRAKLQKLKSKKSHVRRAQSVSTEASKNTQLLEAVTWDIFSPPPLNSVKVSQKLLLAYLEQILLFEARFN